MPPNRYCSCNETRIEATRILLDNHGLSDVPIVAVHSEEYVDALVASKYLVNNSTFPTYFIKEVGANLPKHVARNPS